MNKQILFIALLLAVASAQSEFAPRKCLADVRDGIDLAHSIQANIQSKNLTGLIENGVSAFDLYERVAADCTFGREEIEGGLVACIKDIKELIPVLDEVKTNLNPLNITGLVDNLVVVFELATRIKEDCSKEAQEMFEIEFATLSESEEVGGFAECVQAIEIIVADIQKLEAMNITNIPEIAQEVEAIIFAAEEGLAQCGAGAIDDIINQYFDEKCIEDITNAVILADKIYNETQAGGIRNWEKIARDVIELVHDVQEIDAECGIFNNTMIYQEEEEETFIDLLEDEGFQFNITDCLQQSEIVAKDLDTLLKDIHAAKTQGFDPAEIEAITKDSFALLDNILYDFVPACAGQDIEDDIIEYLPEACLDAIEATTLIVEDIAENEKNIRYILTSLPGLYDSLVNIGKNCENTIGLFVKPFYTIADSVKQTIITN